MVDIGATARAINPREEKVGTFAAGPGFAVSANAADAQAISAYERFCRNAIHAPAQHPIWIKAWLDAVGPDAFFVFVQRNGIDEFALALEVVRSGPFRIARFMGGSHANGNVAAAAKGATSVDRAGLAEVAAAIRKARPDVDIVALERQNPDHAGFANPLFGVKTIQSPNVSLAVDLSEGFAATLSRASGKRKRKKYRQQHRKFEEVGGHRLLEASTAGEVEQLLAEFFDMKADRFRKKGIEDVFASREIRNFFRQLFTRALEEKEPPFVLHALDVAGKLRAVHGMSVQDHSIVCEFGGIRDDDNLNTSPGFFLDYTDIEHACANGKALYDFSVGDEEYKRSWCDVETWQFDVLLPLTAKGRAAYLYAVTRSRAVSYLKSNRLLWSLAKRLRAKTAEAKPEADD